MEAPRGVQVRAAAGDFKASCRKELHLQSTEGEVSSQGSGWLSTGESPSAQSICVWFQLRHRERLLKIAITMTILILLLEYETWQT